MVIKTYFVLFFFKYKFQNTEYVTWLTVDNLMSYIIKLFVYSSVADLEPVLKTSYLL